MQKRARLVVVPARLLARSIACSVQSRCCTRGVTGRDRPHRTRRARLFAIPASGINSRENRANNDACERTSRYAVPERNCEYDLEIARHKAGKGGTGFDSTRLTSPRLALRLRAFEYLFVRANAGHMLGVHNRIICKRTVIAPRRRTTPNPMDPLFSFRFNAPTSLLAAVTVSLFLPFFLSLFLFLSLFSSFILDGYSYSLFALLPFHLFLGSPNRFSFPFCTSRKRTSLRYFCILASTDSAAWKNRRYLGRSFVLRCVR